MSILTDLKYATRLLLKKTTFTTTTILIVAIGLGLTLFTYTLLSSLVFGPLELNAKGPIYSIEAEFEESHSYRQGVDPLDLDYIRNQMDIIKSMGVYGEGTASIGELDNNMVSRKFNSTYVEWNIFEFSGVQPILGRGFTPSDHFDGAEPVIVIGYDVWINYFNKDEHIIGKLVSVDATSTKIIGVMPSKFAFPAIAETWQPLPQMFISPTERSQVELFAFVRLKDGIALSQLQKELKSLNKKVIKELPENMKWREYSKGQYIRALPFKQANVDIIQYQSIFTILIVIVGLIFLLTCINVGNLLLVRVNERLNDIAIRVALGVPRKRLMLQSLLEGIFICTLGGILAIIFASLALEYTNTALDHIFAVNHQKPFWWIASLGLESIIVLIVAIISMILITGYLPSKRTFNDDFNSILKDGSRGSIGKSEGRINNILVTLEILLSCVVLIVSIILLSTSYASSQTDYGVITEKRLTAHIELPSVNYRVRYGGEHEQEDIKNRTAFYYNLKSELEQMPNINAVSLMSNLPGTGEGSSFFEIEGSKVTSVNENPSGNDEIMARNSLKAIGVSIIEGRKLDHRDIVTGINNVLVNKAIADDYFPNGDAVGKRIRRINGDNRGEWNTITGIISNTRHGSAMKKASVSHTIYHLMDKDSPKRINLAMHYNGTEALAIKSLQQAITKIDPSVTAYHVQSYKSLISQPVLLVSYLSKIFLICGIVSVFLAASGIYAISANGVTQRTQEIGVRRALGATDSIIIKLFMNQAIKQLSIGVIIGVAISLWATTLMTKTIIFEYIYVVFGVIGVPALIMFIVLLSTYLPVKKVILKEPSDALHHS